MTDIIDTVQLQEIDDALIELFDITLPDGTTKVYFVNGLDNGTENIYFPERDTPYTLKEYIAIPIALDGIASSSSGVQARPTLTTVNFPSITRSYANNSDGSDDETTLRDILDTENIQSNQDLLNSRVTYRRTLFKHTFKEGDTTSAPIEFPPATFILDRVASEDNTVVAFEVASPIDIEGVTLPNRVVVGKYCPWKYKGVALNGEGGCTWPLNSNGRYYNEEDQAVVSADDDVCGKLISSCKIRFQNGDASKTLPFGGFPGSRTFK